MEEKRRRTGRFGREKREKELEYENKGRKN
jgi:hypothetical protein